MQRGSKKVGKREKPGEVHWKKLLTGTAFSVVTALLLLGGCSILIGSGVIPESVGDACVLLACAVGTLVGGRVTVSGTGHGTLLLGLATGALTVVLLGTTGFLLYDRFESGRCAAVSGACLCGGGLAGVLGGGGKGRRF